MKTFFLFVFEHKKGAGGGGKPGGEVGGYPAAFCGGPPLGGTTLRLFKSKARLQASGGRAPKPRDQAKRGQPKLGSKWNAVLVLTRSRQPGLLRRYVPIRNH